MEELGFSFAYDFLLGKYDFRGRWSAIPIVGAVKEN